MDNKINYTNAEVEIINIASSDVIATSTIGSGNDIDKDGWTTINSREW